jgi:hypothetical protein
MIEELKSVLGKVYLTIETDPTNRWVFTDWQGYLTAENIKVGVQAYTNALTKAGFSCVLNDTRSVRGRGTTPWTGCLTNGHRAPPKLGYGTSP